jgi:hypothetical protein
LRIERNTPAILAPPRPAPRAPARSQPEAPSEREQTALSADYLRDARSAALEQVAQKAPAPDAIALASTERASLPAVVADVSGALPSADTHRSVAPALDPAPESTPSRGSSGTTARGFEPVPVLRAPLAESLSSALGPLAELGAARHPMPPSSRPQPLPAREREPGAGRWLLLAAVALVTVGVVSVGGRLWQRHRSQGPAPGTAASTSPRAAPGAADSTSSPGPASHALLANRPAPEPASDARVRVVSATAVPAGSEPGVGASQESQLAATAGRHVLSGNYAEALPMYRQLERSWPQNTAYGAVARMLEKKVGSRNDTRTITPAAATEP